MEYPEAILAIDDNNIRTAIEEKVRGLVGENRRYTNRTKELEEKVKTLLEAVGVEGDDFNAKLEAASEKGKTLSSELNKAKTELESALASRTELETRLAKLEQQATISTAAQKLGAVPEVLTRLIDDVTKLSIDADNVLYDGKPLKEFASSDPGWKPFLPALFPGDRVEATAPTPPTPQTPTPQLPKGGANGTEPKTDVVESYLSGRYQIPDFLKQ